MPYGLNILGASDKELIVMCLERLEAIEEMLKVPTAKEEALEADENPKKEVVTRIPTKKG